MKEKTLEELWKEASRKKGRLKASLDLYWEWVNREIELVDTNPPRSFAEFLLRPDYSLWYWVSTAFIVATVAIVAVTEAIPIFLPLRYLLGAAYVLFFPGFLLVEALYPKEEELSPLERLALSIGLSLAIVPLIGLVLNYTPFGIRLWPVLYSLAVYMLAISFIASWRKYLYVRLYRGGS
jgi:hypothetical protein